MMVVRMPMTITMMMMMMVMMVMMVMIMMQLGKKAGSLKNKTNFLNWSQGSTAI